MPRTKPSASAPKRLPPVHYLRECFSYNPRTGELRWKHRPTKHFRSKEWQVKHWNGRWAGKVAGHLHSSGYLIVTIGGHGHNFRTHRIIWKLMTGKEPRATIDHKHGKPADNRWKTLRPATQRQQTWNARIHGHNTNGHKGVYRKRSKWGARITILGTVHYLGTFCSIKKAAAAYADAAQHLHGRFYRHQPVVTS